MKPKYLGAPKRLEKLPLNAVCDAVTQLWVELHHRCYRTALPLDGRLAIAQCLGGGVFSYCWAYRTVGQRKRRLKKGCGVDLYLFIGGYKSDNEVFRRVAESITMFVGRANSLRAHVVAQGPAFAEKEGFWYVIDLLFNAAYSLIQTGALGQLQNTMLHLKHDQDAVKNLAEVLLARFEVTDRAATSLAQKPWAKKKIASALGLSLFRAVREVQGELKERQAALVLERFQAHNQRLRRGFYAEVGEGIHELFRIYAEVKRQILLLQDKKASKGGSAEDDAEIAALDKTRNVIGISIIQILDTGFLQIVPR